MVTGDGDVCHVPPCPGAGLSDALPGLQQAVGAPFLSADTDTNNTSNDGAHKHATTSSQQTSESGDDSSGERHHQRREDESREHCMAGMAGSRADANSERASAKERDRGTAHSIADTDTNADAQHELQCGEVLLRSSRPTNKEARNESAAAHDDDRRKRGQHASTMIGRSTAASSSAPSGSSDPASLLFESPMSPTHPQVLTENPRERPATCTRSME